MGCFTANRLTTWSSGNVLTALAFEAEWNNIYIGTIDRSAGRWGSNDDIQVVFGSSQDAHIAWNTSQTTDLWYFGVDATSRTIMIAEAADIATDRAFAAQSNPTLLVCSADAASTTEYLMLQHNGTDALLNVGSGNLLLRLGATTEATITSSGLDLATGNAVLINSTSVLNATTLGSAVVASSLTSVGTLTSLSVSGTITGGTTQTWTDGVSTTRITNSSSGFIGTTSAHTFILQTGGTNRVTLAAASGAVTFTGAVDGITTLAIGGALSGVTTLGMSGALTSTGTTATFTDATSTVRITNAAGVGFVGTSSNHNFSLQTNGTTRTTINTTGAMIHNAASGNPLTLQSNANTRHTFESDGTFSATDGTSTLRLLNTGGVGYFGTSSNHSLTLQTNATGRVTLDTSGGVLFTGALTGITTLAASTSVSTPSIITASGALGITPTAGSNLNVALSTTGDFAVNTSDLYVDTSAGYVGINKTDPGAQLHIVADATTAIGMYLDVPTSHTVTALGLRYNSVLQFTYRMTASETTLAIADRTLGNNVQGPYIALGRNSNAGAEGGAAGVIYYRSADGTNYPTWVDNTGDLRVHSSAPTGSAGAPSVSDTAGTVVGDQTSWYKLKKNIKAVTDSDRTAALTAVVDSRLYSYQMKGKSEKNRMGFVVYNEDRGSWFSQNDQVKDAIPCLDLRNLVGYYALAIQELDRRLKLLES